MDDSRYAYINNFIDRKIDRMNQGTNGRKVNCGCVYSAYILKPVLSGPKL